LGLYTKDPKEERIIRIIYGLLFSALLHLLLLSSFTDSFEKTKPLLQATEKTMTLNLQEILPLHLRQNLNLSLKKPKAPKLPVKKTTKIPLLKEASKEHNRSKGKAKTTKIKPKSKKKIKKKVIKKTSVQPKSKSNSFSDMLMRSGTFMYTAKSQATSAPISQSEKKINKLYGSEFNTYSPTQKKYIKHNLNHVQRITQNTLVRNGYPETARRTKQLGTNIVSFYLHPNGDISGLHLKHRIGYASLDENTLQVIRIAYKDYPLPNQKTRLIFYVKYTILSY